MVNSKGLVTREMVGKRMALKLSIRLAEEMTMSLIKVLEEKSGYKQETRNGNMGLFSDFLSGRSLRDNQTKVTINTNADLKPKRYMIMHDVF